MSRNQQVRRIKWWYGLIVLLAVAVIAPPLYWALKRHDEEQHLSQLQQIVKLVQNGTLKPDKSGDIILPPRFASLTTNGRIYLSRDPKQSFILFPVRIDPLEVEWQTGLPPSQWGPTEHKLQIAGYLYTEQSLTKGWAVSVDDPSVEPIMAEFPPQKSGWYYAEPMYSD